MSGIKVAIFYASVGTGHKSAAKGISNWFLREVPGAETMCMDTLTYASPLVRGLYARSYLEMVRRVPQLWGYLYETMDTPDAIDGFLATINELTERLNLRKLLLTLAEFDPQAVFFTHFFGASVVADALQGQRPVFYVNTDFLSHIFHRNFSFSGWFVASDEAGRQYAADGIDGDRVVVSGIPVDPIYLSPPTKEEGRRFLGISGDSPMFLVMGGGIGVGPFSEVVDSLSQLDGCLIFALCGNNKNLFEKLSERYREKKGVRVLGFVSGMPYYYAAADAVVMKPGGLSTSESLCVGSPLILWGPIPGQEQRNSDYLLDRRAARMIFEPRRAAEKVKEILEDKSALTDLRANMARIARPDAGGVIVRHTLEWIR